MKPYYADEAVQLYLGDMREVLPALDIQTDAAIVDPPYAETSLAWDRWPDGWPSLVAKHTRSMWCFGSLRMFTSHWAEFTAAGWKLSQDVVGSFEIDTAVWEKHNGSGFTTDRFRRVHELASHFYRGPWSEVHHEVPRVPFEGIDRSGKVKRRQGPTHTGRIKSTGEQSRTERLMRSVIYARSCNGSAIHPTEKPVDLLSGLITYAVPPGGLVLDPCAGSASTLFAARMLGRRAVGVEADERYCEAAARRLSIPDLFGGVA